MSCQEEDDDEGKTKGEGRSAMFLLSPGKTTEIPDTPYAMGEREG